LFRDVSDDERRGVVADEQLRDYVLEALEPIGVRARATFGGHGLYLGDKFFGVISEGRLYFRTDEDSREEYSTRGMTALQPMNRSRGPKTVDRNFEVLPGVLESPAMLTEWALRAGQA
jgi:DNA transformation protein and related proteins